MYLQIYQDPLNIAASIEEWLQDILLTKATRTIITRDADTGETQTQVVSRTAIEYRAIMENFRDFLGAYHMDLLSDPVAITRLAATWASARNEAGKERHPHAPYVSANSYNLRLSCISSWYTFARKRYQRPEIVNPMKDVTRRKVHPYEAALPIDLEIVETGMDAIDTTTPVGQRDYALLVVALATGKRASELAGLRRKDIALAGRAKHEMLTLSFLGKGGKLDRKKLDETQSAILMGYLTTRFGKQLLSADPDAPVWISYSERNKGEAITTKTLSNICKKHLGNSKVHALRHTFSVQMIKAGANINEIAKELNHSDIRVTQAYLNEVTKEENPYSEALTSRFGFKRQENHQ